MKTLVGLSLTLAVLSGCGAECPKGTRAVYGPRFLAGRWTNVRECVPVFEMPTLPKVDFSVLPPPSVGIPPDRKLPRRDR